MQRVGFDVEPGLRVARQESGLRCQDVRLADKGSTACVQQNRVPPNKTEVRLSWDMDALDINISSIETEEPCYTSADAEILGNSCQVLSDATVPGKLHHGRTARLLLLSPILPPTVPCMLFTLLLARHASTVSLGCERSRCVLAILCST